MEASNSHIPNDADVVSPREKLAKLATLQGSKPFDFGDVRPLARELWPDDQDVDEFVDFIRQTRETSNP